MGDRMDVSVSPVEKTDKDRSMYPWRKMKEENKRKYFRDGHLNQEVYVFWEDNTCDICDKEFQGYWMGGLDFSFCITCNPERLDEDEYYQKICSDVDAYVCSFGF
jgi:hypothetical protein